MTDDVMDAVEVDAETGEVIDRPAMELAIIDSNTDLMTVQSAIALHTAVRQFVSACMVKDLDFGVIPGTQKPVLLKPGAEKLMNFFRLTERTYIEDKIEDWTGKDHGGEPFFFYRSRTDLFRDGQLIASTTGSANTFEKRYRWRDRPRICPVCKVEGSVIKGKQEYGGGWLCWNKKGGCGAKFKDGDSAIEGQAAGQMPNPDIHDLVNTVEKISGKRSFVGTVIIACMASEFFTQDLDDFGGIPGRAFVPEEPDPMPNREAGRGRPDNRPPASGDYGRPGADAPDLAKVLAEQPAEFAPASMHKTFDTVLGRISVDDDDRVILERQLIAAALGDEYVGTDRRHYTTAAVAKLLNVALEYEKKHQAVVPTPEDVARAAVGPNDKGYSGDTVEEAHGSVVVPLDNEEQARGEQLAADGAVSRTEKGYTVKVGRKNHAVTKPAGTLVCDCPVFKNRERQDEWCAHIYAVRAYAKAVAGGQVK